MILFSFRPYIPKVSISSNDWRSMLEKKWTEAKAIRPLFLRSPPIKGPLPNQEGQNKIEIQGMDGGKGCGAHREKLETREARSLLYLWSVYFSFLNG